MFLQLQATGDTTTADTQNQPGNVMLDDPSKLDAVDSFAGMNIEVR